MDYQQMKAWRTRMGLTQQQAAELLEVDQRHYERYEEGSRNPSKRVIRLCRLYEQRGSK